ncbi:MAG: RES domain-containing protein [Vulcanimicrobiaceae bacterium]
MQPISRGGTYYRVFKPDWANPLDPTYSKIAGGRWNPPGEFGAVYLNQSIEVAAANARAQHQGRAIGLFDLRPERRPHLLEMRVTDATVVDVVTESGIVGLHLPKRYPFGVTHERCWPIARRAYADSTYAGIACRSNAECTATSWLGEELAWFDRSAPPKESAPRRPFSRWYPDVAP